MNTMQEKAFYQLAGKKISDVAVSELFKVTNEHPYFSAAQYFLTYKLQQENHAGLIAQLQKTALFFQNPHWLHYQLLPTKVEIKILHKHYQEEETKPLLHHVIHEEIAQQQATIVEHETDSIPETEKEIPKEITDVFPKPTIFLEPAASIVDQLNSEEKAINIPIEEIIPEVEETFTKTLIEEIKKEPNRPSPIEIPTMETVRQMMDNIQPDNTFILPREIDVQDEIIMGQASPSITSFALDAAETTPYHTPNLNVVMDPAAVEIPVQPETIHKIEEQEESLPQQSSEEIIIANEPIEDITEEATPVDNETETDLSNQKISSILHQQLEEFKKPVAANAVLDISNEPFHAVDYFASQGIKVGADNGSQDKLSKQLRKFTDWLKHMKQAEATETNDLGTDPELETAIHAIAQTSNEAREIVTQTMAEVLEKQGKLDKAIQLYIKLSFLNPEKTAYFATKIEQLKGI